MKMMMETNRERRNGKSCFQVLLLWFAVGFLRFSNDTFKISQSHLGNEKIAINIETKRVPQSTTSNARVDVACIIIGLSYACDAF